MSDPSPFEPHFFARQDEDPDPLFYTEPRLVTHIDDAAIAAAARLYDEAIPDGAAVLDLMSSWRTHLPDSLRPARVAGVGLNAVEMRDNPQLSEFAVCDLNDDPALPYGAAEFDAAICTVSVQYMTRPVEIFAEVARVLRPNAPFILTYSNRMFATKAVRIWMSLDDRERAGLIGAYFMHAGGFGDVRAADISPAPGRSDPLYAVWALREGTGDGAGGGV